MKKILRIGEFSQINQISIQTLRFYDQIGLLKPYKVDPETNYRYYHINQSSLVDSIQYLRQLNFSLEAIKEILSDKDHFQLHQLIEERYQRLLEEKENLEKQIQEIEIFRSGARIYGEKQSEQELEIQTFPERQLLTFEIDQNDIINIKTIEFSHEDSSIFFNLKEESDGTARLLDLIEILFKVSDNHTFVIDEIDRCLHPIMTEKIIELFLKMAEYRNTQLIITSHESRLLADDLLRNDEINFILKTPSGSSIINPLEKYQLRADKKVYAALFDGTLDAIPIFNTNKLESLVQKSSR